MSSCSWPVLLLAGIGLSYALACVVYWVGTRGMGKPFGDSLTQHQRELKKKSAHKRGTIFWVGFVGSFCLVAAAYFMWKQSG